MKWLLNRMAEPSSHGGLAGVLAALTPFAPPQYQAVLSALGALFGALAVMVSEKGAA